MPSHLTVPSSFKVVLEFVVSSVCFDNERPSKALVKRAIASILMFDQTRGEKVCCRFWVSFEINFRGEKARICTIRKLCVVTCPDLLLVGQLKRSLGESYVSEEKWQRNIDVSSVTDD